MTFGFDFRVASGAACRSMQRHEPRLSRWPHPRQRRRTGRHAMNAVGKVMRALMERGPGRVALGRRPQATTTKENLSCPPVATAPKENLSCPPAATTTKENLSCPPAATTPKENLSCPPAATTA